MEGLSRGDAKKEIEGLLRKACLPLPQMPDTGEVVLYGAGNCGREVLALLERKGYEVLGVLDERSISIGQFHGIPCVAPGSDRAARWATQGLPIVLAIFNSKVDLGALSSRLRTMGFGKIVSYYELFERFSESFTSHFWLAPRDFYPKHEEEIFKCLDLWSDDLSRWVYVKLLELRTTFDLQVLRQPDQSRQYLPIDLPIATRDMRFVDGGAFVGDTLQDFMAAGCSFEAIAAFEPDLQNFAHLRNFVSMRREELGDIVLFPCGLGQETGYAHLDARQSAGSRISEFGGSFVPVVAIDDVLPAFRPTMIKLDIEGSEPSAVLGARETINRYGPLVAACLYHAPDHLWSLPFLLKDLRSDYSLALRYHQFNAFDSVVYAHTR